MSVLTKRRGCLSADGLPHRSSADADNEDVWEKPLLAKKLCSIPRICEGEAMIISPGNREEAAEIATGHAGTGPENPLKFSFEDLKVCTNDFCDANLIGKFQFGKVYRGCIGTKEVAVKKWEDSLIYPYEMGDNGPRLQDEITFLQLEKMRSHRNIVKLIGFCSNGEEQLGAVYDLKPVDSVYNLILKDSFTWLQRIKVVIAVARLLEFFHAEEPPDLCYLVRNINAAHFMLDEDYNPILLDFTMITGGVFPERFCHIGLNGCYGYVDHHVVRTGYLSEEIDVFAFGVLLLMLISKRVFREEDRLDYDVPLVHEWALKEYASKIASDDLTNFSSQEWALRQYTSRIFSDDLPTFTLVDESLQADGGFCSRDGHELTMMAIKCVIPEYWKRPTMSEVVGNLLKLQVVQHHSKFLADQQQPIGGDHVSMQTPNAFN